MRTRHGWMRRPVFWLWRYGIAIASVGAALLLTLALRHPEIRGPLFVPAILVSAWYGGLGAGLLAAGLSVLAIDFFIIPPLYVLRSMSVEDAIYLLVFAVSAMLVAWLTGTLRGAEDEVHKQASLLDQSHDAIFVWDFGGTIVYWNKGAEQLYGFSGEEAIGRLSHDLLRTQHPMPTGLFEATIEREGMWSGELTHTTRDGRQVIVDSRQVLMRQADGLRLVLETNRDITERMQASGALQQAQAQLAHVSRVTMLGEITASIAHEVNQPLAAVMMNGNAARRWLAADPPNVDETREAVQRILEDANRAGQVIARIRTLLQSGAAEKTALDCNDIIRETLAFTRNELERKGVAVHTELRDDLPQVDGDRIQLQQVLVNLILNGIDAMAGSSVGSRALTIRSQRDDSGGVVVEVTDRGKGLELGQHERIFDAFFSTKPGGLGMGLAISRSIIEMHGGRIWATPNDGPGASMWFSLPAGEQAVVRK